MRGGVRRAGRLDGAPAGRRPQGQAVGPRAFPARGPARAQQADGPRLPGHGRVRPCGGRRSGGDGHRQVRQRQARASGGGVVLTVKIDRRFTRPGADPLEDLRWAVRKSGITDADGKPIFQMDGVEAPEEWSQLATDILASKYCRPTNADASERETSAKAVVRRVAGAVAAEGARLGYLGDSDAAALEAEIAHLLARQKAAFNTPVWLNAGLSRSYGLEGAPGNWAWNPSTGEIEEVPDALARPQAAACFIQAIDDSLTSIFDLSKSEARIFKYGSGSGTNFSRIRSRYEKLSTGGSPSGLMFFLEVLDKGAGAIRSGGIARKAAKMVCLDADHPEILDFVQWKQREEKKVAVLVAAGYPADFNGEAYRTVSGQNSNNAVRATDAFMRAVEADGEWATVLRTTGEVFERHRARAVMRAIAQAAWACADPGLQFDGTINRWHTCPETAPIRASNPCSEFMFLDESACNLASINIMKFLAEDGGFDAAAFRHAVRLLVIAQDILVDHSSYPTRLIAQNSHDYRPLGLGYANLGASLMVQGMPYDSDEARAWCGALTALMTGEAYRASAELAAAAGPFEGFARNRKAMLGVIDLHREALGRVGKGAPQEMLLAAGKAWDEAAELGAGRGFRNAQTTALAPTGTTGLLMDCDTTGIEPDFALVKFKKLSDGGAVRIVNGSVGAALERLGYGPDQRRRIEGHVLAAGGVEGCRDLKDRHLAVFDCANPSGGGKRFIDPMGHVRMMAAAQPFLSGAISKTVNLPHDSTVQTIEDVFVQSWKLGLKAITLYRDGCKLSQPLAVSKDKAEDVETASSILRRRYLPQTRSGKTFEAALAGQKIYVRTGEYPDGRLGEVFVDFHKPGSPLQELLNCFSILASLALQYGVPLKEMVERFTFTRFEPAGAVQHPNIKRATSVVDFIFRLLGLEYLGRDDLAHVPPGKTASSEEAKDALLGEMMGDSPFCDSCGHVTIRSGSCYKCLNCGSSLGCS
ncbi:MAG: vitamin B12-dependent ribonucleotide reductase [Elusimicrobia bacterium]|nr:vitamin B12-dependent ribonucleotide reductase [Elusimicrobiota bacterium]